MKTVQELPGHSDPMTAMIYTHVMSKNELGIISPLDYLCLIVIDFAVIMLIFNTHN